MFHSNTERLIDYWRERKSGRLAPPRTAIDPADLTDLLPQMFILGRVGPGQYSFRLVGGLPNDLHQSDLRGADFLSLWGRDDHLRVRAAIDEARRAAEPAVIIAQGATDRDAWVRLEIVLAPLRAERDPKDRLLGLYQPLTPANALQRRPILELSLIRAAEQRQSSPRLWLAAVDGRLVGQHAGA